MLSNTVKHKKLPLHKVLHRKKQNVKGIQKEEYKQYDRKDKLFKKKNKKVTATNTLKKKKNIFTRFMYINDKVNVSFDKLQLIGFYLFIYFFVFNKLRFLGALNIFYEG